MREPPGRVCPLRYRYGPAALAEAPERVAETLYVIGGLYGNRPALDAVEALAAAQGHAAARFELGSYYTLGPRQDYKRAADLLRRSALQGFAPAQSSLAVLYWTGKGVPQDRVEAYAWLGLAAEQSEREALDGQPGLQAELNDAELHQARQRARQYRQRPW